MEKVKPVPWTQDEVVRLTQLYKQKLSSVEIGKQLQTEFGVTRSKNSVISKIHRSIIPDKYREQQWLK